MHDTDEPMVPVEQGSEPHDHLSRDPYLAYLVKLANDNPGNLEIGVTLHVNGMIISGMLCSMISFFEEQADMIRRSEPNETAEGWRWFADVFDSLEGELKSQAEAQSAAGPLDTGNGAATDLPEFIHLRAATVHAPGTDAVLPEVLWRGRLDHVSGWSIGNFGSKPPPRNRTAVTG